jgi:hypothetical protein
MTNELTHGRPSTYNNHKCRCKVCTKAWADYIREKGYVRKHQAKKRLEKAQATGAAEPILEDMKVLDLRNPETEKAFLDSLRKYGVPSTSEV